MCPRTAEDVGPYRYNIIIAAELNHISTFVLLGMSRAPSFRGAGGEEQASLAGLPSATGSTAAAVDLRNFLVAVVFNLSFNFGKADVNSRAARQHLDNLTTI